MTDETCPECGRRKAKNAFDASAGDCPKWWAIRDAEAAADCDHYRRKNWHSIAEVLNKPARVGNVVFRAGISTAAVIEAAQRLYEAEAEVDTFVPLHKYVDEIIDGVRKGVGLTYEEMMSNSVEYLPDGSFCVKPARNEDPDAS